MATTLSDVARRAGVSTATVSRVLNDKMVMPIPRATIERIRQAAQELEYQPNLMARALVTGRTHTLGLYSTEMTDPHFAQMLEAVEATASKRGYHLVVSGNLEVISRKGRVDGVIVLGEPDDTQFASLAERIPNVYVHNSHRLRQNLVGWSDEQGMTQAVQYLIGQGHSVLAALFCYGETAQTESLNQETMHCPRAMLAQHPKVTGFRRAIVEAGVQSIECWQAFAPDQTTQGYQYENGFRATQTLLRSGQPFTALVARNDFLALGALRALREAGRRVPEDVSVIGYTDSIHALCSDPALTSVRTPIAEAGEIAVERLLRAIEEGESSFEGTILPTSLTVRESCAPM